MAAALELVARVTLGGKAYAMPITFGMARTLQTAGITPGDIVSKAKRAMAGGPPYSPTHLELAVALHLGASEDGCEMTVEEIGDEIIAKGFDEYAAAFGAYMAGFMTGGLPVGFQAMDMADTGTKKKAKRKRGKKKTRGTG